MSAFTDSLHIVDGLPMPICKFARAHFSKIFRGSAAYGYCASKQEKYYGFRGHLMISSSGTITAAAFAQANIDERDACPELCEKIRGLLIGDKGYIRPTLQKFLENQGIYLQTALRENMEDTRPKWFLKWLISTRRLVETMIGQLTERFRIEKIRTRDLWHRLLGFGENC